MKNEIMTKASRLANTAVLQLKKHSPEILMVAGIAGTITSTVMACKATGKIDEILEEKRYKEEQIEIVMNDDEYDYTEEDKVKDLTLIYTQTGVKLLKVYAPAIALGALSIGCIVAGHNILKKRNLALMAAYTVVDKGFKQYRKNVVDRFGEEIDKELRFNVRSKEIDKVVKDKKGVEKIEKETVQEIDTDALAEYSEFARFFDAASTQFEKDPEYNLMFLRKTQEWANEELKARGHLFLNEVYDMLDIPRTRVGQVVGWIYDTKNPNGDNYVDFGIYNTNNEATRRFINGYEYNILLDFNVDGIIYDKI
jgi:hypothetical protein